MESAHSTRRVSSVAQSSRFSEDQSRHYMMLLSLRFSTGGGSVPRWDVVDVVA